MRKQAKKDKLSFYDVFKIGIEVEGEFLKSVNELSPILENNFEIINDSSIENRKGGNCYELKSKIIKNKVDENKIFEIFKKLETELEERGLKQFAYSNRTAGTHIHFSFTDDYKEKLKDLEGRDKDNYLYIFDSIDFEKYFFQRYFNNFRLKKYWDRINNRYCRTFLQFDSSRNATSGKPLIENLNEVETIKGGRRERYHWLNNDCLREGEGMEIRIYPHLITQKGVVDIINFTKDVLKGYLVKKKNEKKLEGIYEFFKIKNQYRINDSDLKKYDKVLYYSLNIENRNDENLSMDMIEFYNYLFKKNKKCFIKI